ncbi:manganese efflux pump MntP [Amphibacillus sp. Q70]|uniref:manganese efflux pump MntP n=1 Tax=Amphibacillus sp. Q70 TaxID=3453416 RepID=UPI003F826B9A
MLDSVVTPLVLSFVVALDAFSVCLGIGLQPLRLRKIATIGLWIGIFHMFMPLLGLLIGALLAEWITSLTELISGMLLFGLGAQMIFQTFAETFRSNPPKKFNLTAIIVLAFSVSIDSFPIGISLGMSGFLTTVTILLFGGVSTLMSWTSLLIGKKVQRNLDRSLAWIGGAILCLLGLIIIF